MRNMNGRHVPRITSAWFRHTASRIGRNDLKVTLNDWPRNHLSRKWLMANHFNMHIVSYHNSSWCNFIIWIAKLFMYPIDVASYTQIVAWKPPWLLRKSDSWVLWFIESRYLTNKLMINQEFLIVKSPFYDWKSKFFWLNRQLKSVDEAERDDVRLRKAVAGTPRSSQRWWNFHVVWVWGENVGGIGFTK
jgi:hypothetical protein